MLPINDVAAKLGLSPEEIVPYGTDKAKIKFLLLEGVHEFPVVTRAIGVTGDAQRGGGHVLPPRGRQDELSALHSPQKVEHLSVHAQRFCVDDGGKRRVHLGGGRRERKNQRARN